MSERVVVVTGSSGGVDVSKPEDCAAATARIIADHNRVDVLCNNAGIGATGDVVAASAEDWQRVFAVNVFGVANMSRAVLPAMRAAGRGTVVNTCSVVASVGLVDRAVYSASKGAVLALTRSMAADEIAYGIRVNCVSPGTVSSPWVERTVAALPDPEAGFEALRRRQPLGRMISCDEVAAAVVYLAADTTFTTGADFLLDGGITGVRLVD
jgi:2-keto-3-deoxy-L-fuconate dehydrogenase